MTKTRKAARWIIAVTVGWGILLNADEPRPHHADKLTTLLVTIRHTVDGKTLNETSTCVAQFPGGNFLGTVPLNIGGPDKARIIIVAFDASSRKDEAVIRFEVSDTSRVQRVTGDGVESVVPIEILDVVRPRKGDDRYTIYSMGAGQVVIAFDPVEAGAADAVESPATTE